MPKYFTQQIANVAGSQKPPLEPLRGNQIAKRSRIPPIARAQDKNVALGRRVLLHQTMSGVTSSGWLVPSTAVAIAGAQTHPHPDAVRPVAFGRADVTPGHVLQLLVMYVPSGDSQLPQPGGGAYDWNTGGKGGRIRLRVTWTAQDSTTITTEHDLDLEPSGEVNAGEPAEHWAGVRRKRIPLITPGAVNTPALAARWSGHVHVQLELFHIGGARVLDAKVLETPYWVAREEADAANLWTSHLYGAGHPDGPAILGPDYAWGSTATQLVETAQAQGLRLGPQLIHWSAWNEATASLEDVPIARTFSSGTFARLTDGAVTTYNTSEPGWSIESAAFASDAAECDPYYGRRSVPVLVAVYAATGATTTGRLRLHSSVSSWVDVTIGNTSEDPVWHLAYGHLAVRSPSVVQAFVRRISGANSIFVAAMSVYRMGQYSQAA